MEKKTMIWRLKVFLFGLLLGVALYSMFFPLYVNHQDKQFGLEQKQNYKQLVKAMVPEKKASLTDYEEQYNTHLFKQRAKGQTAVPSKRFFQETTNQLGILSIPAVGIKDRGLTYLTDNDIHTPLIRYRLGSSLPGGGRTTHMVLEVPEALGSQPLIEQLSHVRHGDSIQVETYQGIQTYRVFSNRLSDYPQAELEKISFVSGKKTLSIQYSRLFSGTAQIQAEKVSRVKQPRLVASRLFLSYGGKCLIFCTFIVGGFLMLVFRYRVYIQHYYSSRPRAVQTTQKQLYRLLHVTKSYLLIVGMIAVVYLCLIIYRFLN